MNLKCAICGKPYNHHTDDPELMVQLLKEDYWYPKVRGDPLEQVLCDHCGVELAMREQRKRWKEAEDE